MKYRLVFGLWSLVFGLFCTGCSTLDSPTKQDEETQMRSALSEEINKVKHDVDSLKGRIDESEYKMNKISQAQSQQSNELNATLNDWKKETQADIQKRIAPLKNKIESANQKQAQDKKELEDKINAVVEEVSNENKELRRQIDSLKRAPSQTTGQAVYTAQDGYYTVTAGDTLSKIAQAFGVSVKNILEANNITDPNSIHAGQKLIIPKKQ